MKTTFYKLSEALRQADGWRDPYEEDYEVDIVFEGLNPLVGSIGL